MEVFFFGGGGGSREGYTVHLQYVASVGSGYQHQKEAKVLLTTQAIKTDSTFRAKALRRELVFYRLGSE